MYRDSRAWKDEYIKRGALWIHDGNPKRPHVAMTSGGHSDGFFYSGLVMQDPVLLTEACSDLLKLAQAKGMKPELIKWVVGPALGAITIAYELARTIGYRRDKTCLSGYSEKVGDGENRRMVFNRISFDPGDVILPCDDVITTARSAVLMTQTGKDQNVRIEPFLLALVNRSGLINAGGMQIISLIDHLMSNWQPEQCPLCKAGSLPVRAKHDWHRLTAKI